jgi:hypothetical protein
VTRTGDDQGVSLGSLASPTLILAAVRLSVNGAAAEIADRNEMTPLLWVLRDVLGLQGTKFRCDATLQQERYTW